jgi:hypothetical protein
MTMILRFLPSLLLAGGLLLAQEGDPKPEEAKPEEAKPEEAKPDEAKPEGDAPKEEAKPEEVTFQDQEIVDFLSTFDETYKNKKLPEADAVSTLTNLKNAYLYLNKLGDQRTKEQTKLQKDILDRVAKKGLNARDRPIVNIECAKVLGELGDPDGAAPLLKWLEGLLDEKNINPQAIEAGFNSLAWIGKDDKTQLEFVLDYASKGKHTDNTVAAQAIRACYQWRELDGKTRKEFFEKICMYLEGLHSGMTGGDPKRRASFDAKYKAVEQDGKEALKELGDGTTVFEDPSKARAWFNENKKAKWEKYIGPNFRKKAAAPAGAKAGEAKAEG